MTPAAAKIDPYFRARLAAIPAPSAADTGAIVGDVALNLYEQSRQKPRQRTAECVSENVYHVARQGSVSFAQKLSEGRMTKTAHADTRTKADCSEWLKNKRSVAKEVRLALVSDFDHLRARNKEIARHADCSPRTVEAWTDPEIPTLPGLEHFLRLVPRSPSIQKMLMRLMTLDADLNPEHQVAFMQLVRTIREATK